MLCLWFCPIKKSKHPIRVHHNRQTRTRNQNASDDGVCLRFQYSMLCFGLWQVSAKGNVAAWSDMPKPGVALGNLTPADRHGSVQVRARPFCIQITFHFLTTYTWELFL